MKDSRREITEKEYFEYKNKSRAEINKFIESKLPISIIMGYGYYGGDIVEEDGKYYMVY